jgi:hypothetical protein
VGSAPLADASALPWPAIGVVYFADHKGARNGCKGGILTLKASSLVFYCPSDQNKSILVPLAQVVDVDDDGIKAYPHEKFHFNINGKSQEETHALFLDWKARAALSENVPSN